MRWKDKKNTYLLSIKVALLFVLAVVMIILAFTVIFNDIYQSKINEYQEQNYNYYHLGYQYGFHYGENHGLVNGYSQAEDKYKNMTLNCFSFVEVGE